MKTFLRTHDQAAAKRAVDHLKKQLPAITVSGKFSRRENDALIQHSGCLCADLDDLNSEKLAEARTKQLLTSPYLWALFRSPTGKGLKVILRVPADASKHLASFRAVEQQVLKLTGIQIDQSRKDLAGLCFVSFDPDCYFNPDAREIEPLPEPEKPKTLVNGVINLSERQRIAMELLGAIDWQSETSGFVTCPGKHLHTTGDGDRDCKVELDNVPTAHCFHNSCHGILDAINRELRSRIGKAENARPHLRNSPNLRGNATNSADADAQSNCEINEPNELPPAAAPYVTPPLDLLPSELQDYICAAAESINVDVAFIMLPKLSSLATAIGNARSILLKQGFVQPPVVWTGIIARSGGRKSPSEQEGCFSIMAHERELMGQNKEAAEIYADELSQWESQRRKRGHKPDEPQLLTCICDDLTIEVLADILTTNPRGILVRKDELSHWLASFDQYKNAKGSDVSRWLSLHTAVSVAVDRRTDSRHYRIANPRVSITGGIQPTILQRALTPEFFERGLPARFVFAYPPFRQDKWSKATVPDDLRARVLDLFSELWLLQPKDTNPRLLPLDREAKTVFVDFYNECGESAVESSEHDEAVWSKLTGYGARFALIGQLAHNPHADVVTGAIMEAACRFARWSGNEAVRIYEALAETQEEREQRELCDFVQRRGRTATLRDTITYYWPLKNKLERAQQMYDQLVKSGRGKWEEVHPSGPGRPTRIFRLLPTSASAKIPEI
jgi:Protein of unknown function (DUF3987)/VirE N-terminal domain